MRFSSARCATELAKSKKSDADESESSFINSQSVEEFEIESALLAAIFKSDDLQIAMGSLILTRCNRFGTKTGIERELIKDARAKCDPLNLS